MPLVLSAWHLLLNRLCLCFLVGFWWPRLDSGGIYKSGIPSSSRLGDVCLCLLLCIVNVASVPLFMWSSWRKICLGRCGKSWKRLNATHLTHCPKCRAIHICTRHMTQYSSDKLMWWVERKTTIKKSAEQISLYMNIWNCFLWNQTPFHSA